MPAPFRQILGPHFVVCRSPGQCLLAISLGQWQTLTERYKESRLFRGYYVTNSSEVRVDLRTGRFLIPVVLRQYAELRAMDEVAISGIGRAVQLTRRSRWEGFLKNGDFPGLGQLEQDLEMPRPEEARRFRCEEQNVLGVPVLRCQGRLNGAATRRLREHLLALTSPGGRVVVLDVREAGNLPTGLGLLFAETAEKRIGAGCQYWVLAGSPVPDGDNIRIFNNIEELFWSLGKPGASAPMDDRITPQQLARVTLQ